METETKESSVAGFITLIVLVVLMILGICYLNYQSNPIRQELNNYRSAVKICGIENIEEHNYNNGSKDWSCEDYSKVK